MQNPTATIVAHLLHDARVDAVKDARHSAEQGGPQRACRREERGRAGRGCVVWLQHGGGNKEAGLQASLQAGNRQQSALNAS